VQALGLSAWPRRARGVALVLSAAVSACSAGHTKGAAPRAPAGPAAVPAPSAAAAPEALAEPSPPVEDPSPYAGGDEEGPDDGAEAPADLAREAPPGAPRPHPLDGWSTKQIELALRDDPESLGSISLGRPGAGGLVNGVQMPPGEGWVLLDPGDAWGTRETVDDIERAISAVRNQFPDSHPIYIGHISSRHGGALRPHVSHQAGRDVDLSYYVTDDSASHYGHVSSRNLDGARSWAFVRALITETDVELILIDHSIQQLLRDYALQSGEDPEWVSSVFDGVPGSLRPLILHAKGHDNHLHARFFNPIAQETARRAWEPLVRLGFAKGTTGFTVHRAKKGETLGMLARKYGTTVRAIQTANGLRGTLIRARASYRIPRRGKLAAPQKVVIPARRLPPATALYGARPSG
jgi:murein endopeptidase